MPYSLKRKLIFKCDRREICPLSRICKLSECEDNDGNICNHANICKDNNINLYSSTGNVTTKLTTSDIEPASSSLCTEVNVYSSVGALTSELTTSDIEPINTN